MVYFLLAESKLSCMNVRNSDKRTQTTTNVVTMRINCGEHLPKLLGCSSLESDLTTSPALSLLQGGGRKGEGSGEEKKEKEMYKDSISMLLNQITTTLDDLAYQRVF